MPDPKPDGFKPPENLLIGKVTLAQILNGEGEYKEAAVQLTEGKAKVVDAIQFKGDGDRPERGVTSARFAGLAYQQLLMAQVGLGDIDAAQQTIEQIEQVSAGGNVRLFQSLGERIQEDLESRPQGQERTAARKNLASFLDKIAGAEGKTYGSLMWVAETYDGLAGTLPETDQDATTYRSKAAKALRDVLDPNDGKLPAGENRAAAENFVRGRLAAVLAAAGDYAAGYDEVKKVLADKPNALDMQVVAADLLADQGAAETDGGPTLVKALVGDEAANVWGWGKIAKTLNRLLLSEGGERYQDDYNNARLRIPQVRAALAETKSGDERAEEYATAETELLSWIALTEPEKISPETRREAEELYERLQKEQGVAVPKPLPTEIGAPVAPIAGGDDTQVAGAPGAAGPKPGDAEEVDDGPNVVLLIIGLVILGLITAGAIVAFRPKPRKRAARRSKGKSAEAAAAAKGDSKGRGSVRSSLPDLAPMPVAAPAAEKGPTGTDFPDFAALPQKKAARPAAGAAPRTRVGSSSSAGASGTGSSGKTRRPSGSSSSGSSGSGSSGSGSSGSGSGSAGKTRRSSSGSSASEAASKDGKTARRRSSSSGSSSSGSSSSGSSSSGSSSSGSSGSSASGSGDTPRKRRPKPPTE